MFHFKQRHYILQTWPHAILDLWELGLMWWVQDQEVWIIGCEDIVFEEVCECYFWPLFCMGWFGWVAVGRGFVAVIWCVWFWVLAMLRWEVSGIGAVVCDCVGASHWSCYWGINSDGGMSAEVTVLQFNYWWYPSRKCGWFWS